MRSMPTVLFAMAFSVTCMAATPSGIDLLRWKRRVLLVSAPVSDDLSFLEQRRLLLAWRAGAEDRDVTTVQVVGDSVDGSTDRPDTLRRRFGLSPDRFAVVLIGKDGHVALRSERPLNGVDLGQTIDAMPMRRSGQR